MRRYDIDQTVRRLSRSQHGIWTDRQALRNGISRAVTSRRVRGGEWITLHPGVRALAGWQRTLAGEALAAAWSFADGAVSHGTSARLLHIEGSGPGPIEVTVPRDRRQPRPFVVHESRLLTNLDVATIDCVPCTTVTRTLIDLSSSWNPDRLTTAVSACLVEGRTNLARLQRTALPFMGSGSRSAAALTTVLARHDDADPPPESELERVLLDIVAEGGYGVVRRQVPLHPLAGVRGRVDGFIDSVGLVLEADGRRWHTRVADLERDRRRDDALQAAGFDVMRFGYEEVVHDRQGVLAVLDIHFATRGFERDAAGLWIPKRAA